MKVRGGRQRTMGCVVNYLFKNGLGPKGIFFRLQYWLCLPGTSEIKHIPTRNHSLINIDVLVSTCSSVVPQEVKPIFHCDAKYLASGVDIGQCPRRQNFALEIPTCWYILALPNDRNLRFP